MKLVEFMDVEGMLVFVNSQHVVRVESLPHGEKARVLTLDGDGVVVLGDCRDVVRRLEEEGA